MEKRCEYSKDEFVQQLVKRGICRCKGRALYIAWHMEKNVFCEEDFIEAYRLDANMFDEYERYNWKEHFRDED